MSANPNQISEEDRSEIELFKLYLRAIARWDNEHDELPDFAPISELVRVKYEKKRAQAHHDIYEQIYEPK